MSHTINLSNKVTTQNKTETGRSMSVSDLRKVFEKQKGSTSSSITSTSSSSNLTSQSNSNSNQKQTLDIFKDYQ